MSGNSIFFFATVSTEDHKSMSVDFKDTNSFYWIDEAAKTESEIMRTDHINLYFKGYTKTIYLLLMKMLDNGEKNEGSEKCLQVGNVFIDCLLVPPSG